MNVRFYEENETLLTFTWVFTDGCLATKHVSKIPILKVICLNK